MLLDLDFQAFSRSSLQKIQRQ